MSALQLENPTQARKSKFVHFRWLLFIWLGAVAAVHAGTKTELSSSVYVLFSAFLLSQALLWSLPLKYYEGLNVLNAIFLLDINFVLLGFGISHQLQPELVMTLFLGTFMAALSRSMGQSMATTVVIIAVYLGFKMRTPEGFNFNQPQQLLQLPFLFISSMHSSLLAQEAGSELEARKNIEGDKNRMSRHMNSTFAEIAHYCKDMSALVDALPFGAIMLDSFGKLRICNDIAEEVLGVDAASLLDKGMDSHPRLALLTSYLEKAINEPLSDFLTVDFPSESGGTWSLNLGVYPVREGDASRGLLMVLIPQGVGDVMKEALPRPLLMPQDLIPVLDSSPRRSLQIPGLSLTELGLNYG